MYRLVKLVDKSTYNIKGHNITINLLVKHVEINKAFEE
jgi:hypothetical protein